tara:strand:+ start:701 stop:871 length:171 start_codon:yes stop_codon:yes gene_type:complete
LKREIFIIVYQVLVWEEIASNNGKLKGVKDRERDMIHVLKEEVGSGENLQNDQKRI